MATCELFRSPLSQDPLISRIPRFTIDKAALDLKLSPVEKDFFCSNKLRGLIHFAGPLNVSQKGISSTSSVMGHECALNRDTS